MEGAMEGAMESAMEGAIENAIERHRLAMDSPPMDPPLTLHGPAMDSPWRPPWRLSIMTGLGQMYIVNLIVLSVG